MTRAGSSSKPVSKLAPKPYDRPSSNDKGKGKAPAGSLSKPEVNRGAPSQLGQSSRKGKKAWRKNIDITQEEGALEQAREEERVTGGKVAEKRNDELFVVDVVGDVEVAKKMRRTHKPLRSLAVLSERSAVPSLTSRPRPSISTPTSSSSRKTKLSAHEKARLRRIARKDTLGSDGTGLGSADVKLVADSQPLRDAWSAEEAVVPVAEGGFGQEGMVKPTVKAPITLARQMEIRKAQIESGRAVELPEGGVSYNPSQEAHEKLLEEAVKEELGKLASETRAQAKAEVLGNVVEGRKIPAVGEYAEGMIVGDGEPVSDADEEDSDGKDVEVRKKPTKRKTQAQRNKAARAKEALLREKALAMEKKLLRSVGGVRDMRKEAERRAKQHAESERLRRLAKKEKERMGFEGGEKVGKHRVKKTDVAVQLGEDLAESLRQVKPEGNLFKDRFLALQKRALIEPRVPQLPKRRVRKVKEYEKHAYKRFE